MKHVYAEINAEMHQQPETRRKFFNKIEHFSELDGRTLVTFFTSFNHPVQMEDADCDALEAMLQKADLKKGLALMVSSPGGNGLAAERIVNVCRAYSGTKDYWAIVPGKAKSAGTIVCMGASKILMSCSSELGPVDPQIFTVEDGRGKAFSLHNLVQTYKKLFNGAAKTKGRLEPYLQQLSKYDSREIATYEALIQLANDIAQKVLSTGMMKGQTSAAIKRKIEIFLNPAAGTLAHGRPIFVAEAKRCGLNCDEIDVKSDLWQAIYELYVRTNAFVSNSFCKTIESSQGAFHAPAPSR